MIQWPEQWRERRFLAKFIAYSTKDFIVAMTLYLLAVILCILIRQIDGDGDNSYVAMIFLMEVFLTALWTDGYLFSILMAVTAMLSVNYIFMPPYWDLSLSLGGFPVTTVVMLTIAITTGAITSRAKQQKEAEREAERERIHSNLLRAISHDIRTPLTGIVGATSVMLEQEELSEAQKRELLQGARQDAQWLIRIVENLLTVTRIAPGENAAIKKVSAVVEEVISAAVTIFKKRYPGIPVRIDLPEEIILVPMDELLIQQVLINLLENAAIHGGDVTEIVAGLGRRGQEAYITVSDDGCGIPRLQLEKLFDGSVKHSVQGDKKRNMGIGLSVCKTIVEAHGGTIRAENRKEGGACFIVTLPMEESTYDED